MRTERIEYPGKGGESVIIVHTQAFAELSRAREELKEGGGLIFTDENVYSLYRDELERSLGGVPVSVMPAGEEHKNEETLFKLLNDMARNGLRRNSKLIALGGGVVGDVGGLAASLYMRGISCFQVPTTLLAQVDSSVGGKTAVDFCGVKNLVGAFHFPAAVLVDPAFLRTLPAREIVCGLGEMIKHGALCPPLFEKLWQHRRNLTDPDFLAEIVPENIAFKASVVERDPFETGERKRLNLGHTTAHAVELGGTELSHGECVLWGLLFEGNLARRRCETDGEFLDELFALCRAALGEKEPPRLANAGALARYDKKNCAAGTVAVVAPTARGECRTLELSVAEYESEIEKIGEELRCG